MHQDAKLKSKDCDPDALVTVLFANRVASLLSARCAGSSFEFIF
ncbi:hypothetical protein VR7878_03631 [Vibrio ruber DSM 16370]|uniref:Uncharacterized protein n=1 Tax=Vibrio ruber (strain DSM 16370 / JCM 11486 / BCRC 17186 / CECT 7878 / LMG 23124 / VR1) TaxID=1123498 RepID=A0A1R4LT17_VIBR1|nr:hypothetical protein VR7878_03631 [Vibrio ruber DSM 16370]